jgi:uncharacterized membrane protein
MSATSGTTSAQTSDAPTTLLRHPTVQAQLEKRAASVQLRIADGITAFAGSMTFVYVHIVLFALWMTIFEKSPWPTLTLVVSLEAIFLSTFVMIGQNRQASFQQAKADHDFVQQELELRTNTDLTRQIHTLTQELHKRLLARAAETQARAEAELEGGQTGQTPGSGSGGPAS